MNKRPQLERRTEPVTKSEVVRQPQGSTAPAGEIRWDQAKGMKP